MPETEPSPTRRRPALVSALGLAALIATSTPGCGSPTPDAVFAQGREAMEGGRFDRAEAAVVRLAALREPTSEDRLLRAQVAMALRRTDEALEELAKIPDDHGLAAEARLRAGQLELRRDRIRFAERLFREAIRLRPDLSPAHRELIYIYGMQLRRRELDRAFRLYSELEPLSFQQVFLWCLSTGLSWEPREQSEDLMRYVEADPDDRASRLALVDVLRRLNQLDEAERVLEPLNNDDPDARASRVRLALDRGDQAKAAELLNDGPRVHLDLAMLRGRVAIAGGDGRTAVLAFRDAVAADPTSRDAVHSLANALRRAGDPEAKRYAEESAHLERVGSLIQRASAPGATTNAPLLRDLGAACAAADSLPQARAWYALAIKLDPLDAEAQRGLFRLKAETPAP